MTHKISPILNFGRSIPPLGGKKQSDIYRSADILLHISYYTLSININKHVSQSSFKYGNEAHKDMYLMEEGQFIVQ